VHTPTTVTGTRFATQCPPTTLFAPDRPPCLELRDTLSPQTPRRRRVVHAGNGRSQFCQAQTTITPLQREAASQPGGRRGGVRRNWGDTETVNPLHGGTRR
jgi:hypothetical protein